MHLSSEHKFILPDRLKYNGDLSGIKTIADLRYKMYVNKISIKELNTDTIMSNKDKLGVALTKECCPACCKEMDGSIVINKKLDKSAAKKVEELHNKVVGFADHFCDECQGFADQGIIFIGVHPEKTEDPNNPWRSGIFSVVKEEAVKTMMADAPETLERVLKDRMVYIPHDIALAIGLVPDE